MQLGFSLIPATKTFHKHGFLLAVSHFPYHSRIITQLLMSQGPVTWPFDREQHSRLGGGKCNILKCKKHNKNIFLAKIFFAVVFHMFWTIEKQERKFRFSGTLNFETDSLPFFNSGNTLKKMEKEVSTLIFCNIWMTSNDRCVNNEVV